MRHPRMMDALGICGPLTAASELGPIAGAPHGVAGRYYCGGACG
jgi:hypothetical protein